MRTDFEQQVAETLHALTPEPAERHFVADRRATSATTEPHEFIPVMSLQPRAAGRRRWRHIVPIAASIAVLAAAGTVVGVVATHNHGGKHGSYEEPAGPTGKRYAPHKAVPQRALGAKQYDYRVLHYFNTDANGKAKKHDPTAVIDRSWISANGDIRSFRSGAQTDCYLFEHNGDLSFESPTRAFFAAMPTDVGKLTSYFRSHVQGSSSRDEAVFVAVGDSLRFGGAFASPLLRAAMVSMLSRTPGVFVHANQHDFLGRPAVRADFVDQRIRPGEIHSYYFDPTTYAMLEERNGSNGQRGYQPGQPSRAYSAHAASSNAATDVIAGRANVNLMTTEKTVTTLPKLPKRCHRD